MGIKEELEQKIAQLQSQLDLFNTFPLDTFDVGVIAHFSNAQGETWFYLKTGDDVWLALKSGGGVSRSLYEWLYLAKTISDVYFEVRILEVPLAPIYSSP